MAYTDTHDEIAIVPPAPIKAGAIYTCPMHPQIRQVGPGNCPICGMTLEPVKATAAVGENHELTDMTRRFWIGLALTLPVFVLEMGGHIPALGLHDLVPPRVSVWIQFALSTPVVLWAGWPFFERAWASVVHRSLNMFSLIALGTGAAYLYSLFATFAPGWFPAGFHEMGGTVPVYFEAAAVITVLVLLGQVLELRAREQTGGAIRALLKLAPKTAYRLKDGGEDDQVALELVQVGDRLRVRPGDGVPVDGEFPASLSIALRRAAIHSYTKSLRVRLDSTGVTVPVRSHDRCYRARFVFRRNQADDSRLPAPSGQLAPAFLFGLGPFGQREVASPDRAIGLVSRHDHAARIWDRVLKHPYPEHLGQTRITVFEAYLADLRSELTIAVALSIRLKTERMALAAR